MLYKIIKTIKVNSLSLRAHGQIYEKASESKTKHQRIPTLDLQTHQIAP
ncbi:hypothetical protein VCHA41O247_50173 [Vibrio chagasii]|nr:hypothetical protein VCHA48P434_20233 [Vibrio chagasii]CAH7360366.1 hypothetical protein VCHA41O247_50173 [Vibrio chagasii]